MADQEHVREHIERAIERARDGMSETIDELDRNIRSRYDVTSMVQKNAPALIGGGLALGFLVGFGVPKLVKRAVQVGVPLYVVARVASARLKSAEDGGAEGF
jgi:hypothetical protein